MLFYAQLQQIDGKWNDKWAIMVRKWMKDMSISDGKMDKSRSQQLSECMQMVLLLEIWRKSGLTLKKNHVILGFFWQQMVLIHLDR